MKIYETAVRKPISVALIFIGVIVFGLFSLKNLGVDQYPDIEIPYISVITMYPGGNAEDIETNITRVLEDQLNTVDNLDKITSKSQDNVSIITLEFEYGCDLVEAANDVRDVVSRSQSLLPDNVEYPTVMKFSSSMIPVMMLSVTADESYNALPKILDDKLVNELNRINGIGSVAVIGAREREVQVHVDPVKLESYGLSVETLGGIIAAENANVPAGKLDIGTQTFNLKSDFQFDDSRDLENIVVSNIGGRKVMLKDVATIEDTLEEMTMDERINGRNGVRILVQKQTGANTVEIVEQVQEKLTEIIPTLPPDCKVETIYEGSQEINDAINSLAETIMFAFIFVILVVMFFLGRWRATFIICLTIPISLICAFIYLYATGSTLNIISLSALSIAIGMVVDDAIVVLENITTHIERGSKPKEAAIYATNEVWLSVIATTLVVVAVFLPLTMIPGMSGILFKELGWIVTIVVCVSTTAAITLTPMLSAYMLKLEGGEHSYKGIGIVYKPIDLFLRWLDRVYEKMLRFVVRWKKTTILVLLAFFGVSLMLLSKVPTEFFPPTDNARLSMSIELPQNTHVDETVKVARRIDSLINEKYPYVRMVSTSAGESSSDNAFAAMQTTGSNLINYTIRLPRLTDMDRPTIFEIADELRAEIRALQAELNIEEFTVTPGGQQGGMGGASTVDIKIFGHDMDLAMATAKDLQERMSSLSTMRDVQLSRDDLEPEFNVRWDVEKLSQYGLTKAQVAQMVRNRFYGFECTKYREDGDEYNVVVRYEKEHRLSIEDVENMAIYTPMGTKIRVKDVGYVVEESASPVIERENRQRIITVKGSVGAGVALGDAVTEVNALLAEYDVPEGLTFELGGSIEDQGEAFGDIAMLLILIIILVYIVMATQFESLVYPFIIMFTIPFAMSGVFIALWITSTPLSLIALIGAIMLVGIVTKNGIVMVDYMNLLVERGSNVADAVIAGGKSRLRPVLMTSLTTILGMVPMAMGIGEGSEMWQPMGISVVGGLLMSTVLTLFIVPALYAMLQGRKERKAARKARREAEEEAFIKAKKLAAQQQNENK
ncbi:MAG: efflux RND transporter permease subunit [Alistipes sp.]|nr:efflux RND transporter permease subunit [Alistipes sp.]